MAFPTVSSAPLVRCGGWHGGRTVWDRPAAPCFRFRYPKRVIPAQHSEPSALRTVTTQNRRMGSPHTKLATAALLALLCLLSGAAAKSSYKKSSKSSKSEYPKAPKGAILATAELKAAAGVKVWQHSTKDVKSFVCVAPPLSRHSFYTLQITIDACLIRPECA